jgi:uncharacterized membrane protein
MTTVELTGRTVSWALWVGSATTASLIGLGLALGIFGMAGSAWILTSGLTLLVALPVFRLIAVLGSLALAREWRFVLAGLAVLALLAVTLLWRSD